MQLFELTFDPVPENRPREQQPQSELCCCVCFPRMRQGHDVWLRAWWEGSLEEISVHTEGASGILVTVEWRTVQNRWKKPI